MRDDMAKVVVERPRRGGNPLRKWRLKDTPKSIGLHRDAIERGGDKELNENHHPPCCGRRVWPQHPCRA
jgi:hypothetical protein